MNQNDYADILRDKLAQETEDAARLAWNLIELMRSAQVLVDSIEPHSGHFYRLLPQQTFEAYRGLYASLEAVKTKLLF